MGGDPRTTPRFTSLLYLDQIGSVTGKHRAADGVNLVPPATRQQDHIEGLFDVKTRLIVYGFLNGCLCW